VPWQVEILDETVAAEIAALPADMQARFLRLASASGRLAWKAWANKAPLRQAVGVAADRPRWNCPRALRHGDRPQGRRGARIREEDAKTPRAEIELALRRAKDIR
jgi:hypothetical protein